MRRKALFIALSCIVQLISIPVFNEIGYAITLIFHEPYIGQNSIGMDFYGFTIYFILYFSIITFPIILLLQEWLKKEWIITSLHVLWFLFILFETKGALYRHPYTHSLLLVCVAATIIVRIVFRKLFYKRIVGE